MYPLHEEYETRVLNFLKGVKKYEGVHVETNGMSTQLFGEYDVLMNMLHTEMKEIFEAQPAIFVLKIGRGELKYEEQG